MMKLLEILEEISVGYNNGDEKSDKLKEKIKQVRSILERKDMLLEGKQLDFELDLKNENSSTVYSKNQIFFQGSYAISTAIKHENYDVDADLGFFIDEELPIDARKKVYDILVSSLSQCEIKLKKPCIEIDFRDGYKIDVAIYSRKIHNVTENEDIVYFHNSIDGSENISDAKPKAIVRNFRLYLAEMPLKRSVIRLMKHFMKNSQKKLEIDDNNKLPSISLMLIASESFFPGEETANEENLITNLKELCDITLKALDSGEQISSKELLIYNTLYKVTDINDTKKIISSIKSNLTTNNLAELVSESVYSNLMKKEGIDTTPSIRGTMGTKCQ